jgi:hypothetical protein
MTGPAPNPGAAQFMLTATDVDLWAVGVDPNVVAEVDAARTLLNDRPRNFPAPGADPYTLDSYLDGLRCVFGLDVPGGWRDSLAQGILSYATSQRPGGELTPGAVWLLNSWSADQNLQAFVVRHIAAMDDELRPYDLRLESAYWTSLAADERLAGYVTVPGLIVASREAVADPGEKLARRMDEGGVRNTPLALNCYGARLKGQPIAEIIRVLNEAGAARLEPRQLDDLLREIQGLLFHGRPDPQSADQELVECYRLIADGRLGPEYGTEFASYVSKRLRDNIKVFEYIIRLLANPAAQPDVPAQPTSHREPKRSLLRRLTWFESQK